LLVGLSYADGVTLIPVRVNSGGELLTSVSVSTPGVMANNEVTPLSSAARTATTDSPDLSNPNWRGGQFILDVTAKGAAPSITVTIQGKDLASGQYYTLLTGAAVTTVSTTVYRVYPGLTAAANSVANDVVPSIFRVHVVHGNSDSITYSVGFQAVQ